MRTARPETVIRLAALALACGLAGCSTLQTIAGIEKPGNQADGSYVLTPNDLKLGCRGMHARVVKLVERMKVLPAAAQAEQQMVPRTVTDTLGRAFGKPGDGLKASQEQAQSLAEAKALNEQMGAQGCGMIDIDGLLAEGEVTAPPAAMTH